MLSGSPCVPRAQGPLPALADLVANSVSHAATYLPEILPYITMRRQEAPCSRYSCAFPSQLLLHTLLISTAVAAAATAGVPLLSR